MNKIKLVFSVIFAVACSTAGADEKIEVSCEEYSKLAGIDYCKSAKTMKMTPAAYESAKRQAAKSEQKNRCKESPGAEGCKPKTVRLWGRD